MRKIEIQSWEELVMEEIMAFDAMDDELELLLADTESYEELIFEKDDRDLHRWELDPASAEDYRDHARAWRGPAGKWRHFGH